MKTDIEIYADDARGVRLVIERDIPGSLRFSLYWEEDGTVSLEEINAAIHRLMLQAGLLPESEEQG